MKRAFALVLLISVVGCGPAQKVAYETPMEVAPSQPAAIHIPTSAEYFATMPRLAPGGDQRAFAQQLLTWVTEPGHMDRYFELQPAMLDGDVILPNDFNWNLELSALAAEGVTDAEVMVSGVMDIRWEVLTKHASEGNRVAKFFICFFGIMQRNIDESSPEYATAQRYLEELAPTEPLARLISLNSQGSINGEDSTQVAAEGMNVVRSGTLGPFVSLNVVKGWALQEPPITSPEDDAEIRSALESYFDRLPPIEVQQERTLGIDSQLESARFGLASMFEKGRGGPPDIDRAVRLYREGYSMGNDQGETGQFQRCSDALIRLGVPLTDSSVPLREKFD